MQINCKNERMLVKWCNFGERHLFFEKGFDILKKTKLLKGTVIRYEYETLARKYEKCV